MSLEPFVIAHLWQSTLFAAAIGLLTLSFRKHSASVRHGLWMAASLKFLVPFAALTALGSQFAFRTPIVAAIRDERDVVIVAKGDARSFPAFELLAPWVSPDAVRSSDPGRETSTAVAAAAAIWIGGSLVVLAAWTIRWRRVAAIARAASAVDDGPEVDALRRIERAAGIRRPIGLVSSDAPLEPGVFGILRPVLVWPRTIGAQLGKEQIETILAHEVSHVRRRDNLSSAIHMGIQAAFWFHPVVWWIGARLVDERERACDEAVLTEGSEPQAYAEGILSVCRHYLESPVPCVSGVTGADLRKRIETIMTSGIGVNLSVSRKIVLATVALAAVSLPVVSGIVHAQPTPSFEVASVKLNVSADPRPRGWQSLPGG